MKSVNIAENKETIFISINKDDLNSSNIDEILDYLWDIYNSKLGIPPVSSLEQSEIEVSLMNLSENDREIVKAKTIKLD